MTYKELKKLKNKILDTRLKILEIEAMAESTTAQLTGVKVTTCTSSDRVGNLATQTAQLQTELKQLQKEFRTELDRIPQNVTGRCIKLKLLKNYSWIKLSFIASDKDVYVNEDTLKARCHRLKW